VSTWGCNMRMKLVLFEIKNIIRDRLMLMFVFYPFIIGFVARMILNDPNMDPQAVDLLVILSLIISGFIFGALAGFSILDDRDDHVFTSISISPMPLKSYIFIKLGFITFMSILSSIAVILVAGITFIEWPYVLLVALLSSLQVPLHGMLINSFASNKVEGFVVMKASGFLLIFPIAGFFFVNNVQWVFALAPAFWPAKAVQAYLLKPLIDANVINLGLNYWGFLGVGLLVMGGYNFIVMNLFKRKVLQ
jgi:fluoroquinolone transport system permease protein